LTHIFHCLVGAVVVAAIWLGKRCSIS